MASYPRSSSTRSPRSSIPWWSLMAWLTIFWLKSIVGVAAVCGDGLCEQAREDAVSCPEDCCFDSSTWFWHSNRGKDKKCNWVNNNPSEWRCTKVGSDTQDSRVAEDACPVACGICAISSPCDDSESWTYTTKSGKQKTCNWVAQKESRCSKLGEDGGVATWAYIGCPLACGKCSASTPTASPTSSPPTSGPTAFPTGDPSAIPTSTPTAKPSSVPSREPTSFPTAAPSAVPSAGPTNAPSAAPSPEPSSTPTAPPSSAPTSTPSASLTSPPTSGLTPTFGPREYVYLPQETDECTAQGTLQGPEPNDPGVILKLKFWAMGDAPYNDSQYASLRDTILPRILETDSGDFMAHVGDIQQGNPGGGVTCNEDSFRSRKDLFDAIEPDLDFFIVPGDNEWNECANYGDPPPDSAEDLWRHYFANAGSPFRNFDRDSALPTSDVPPPVVYRDSNYPENFFFSYLDVAFFGINEPASHSATDPDSLYNDFAGDVNAFWIQTKLDTLPPSPSALVVFGHSNFSNEVKDVLKAQGATPILYVTGNAHPDDYCMKYVTNFPNLNLIKLTVEPFEAGPLLVSIVEDHFGTHFFHVEETDSCA